MTEWVRLAPDDCNTVHSDRQGLKPDRRDLTASLDKLVEQVGRLSP